MIRVVAGAILSHGRVLIARRRDDRLRGGLWEFPGGKVKRDEEDTHALARELSEELDVLVYVEDVIARVEHAYPELTIELTLYRCRIRAGGPRPVEHAELKWVARDELQDVAFDEADARCVAEILRRDDALPG